MDAMPAQPHAMLVTVAVAVAAGAMLMVIARKLETSAIGLLLLGGIALGPQALGFVQPDSLGRVLPVLVSLAVGLILFEGGLTLDLKGYLSTSAIIRRLLTVGVVVTWLTTSVVVWLLFRFPVPVALLAGSLVIVTGPTVIAPLLKRINIVPRIHHILHWEGVMIDPIGVFVALLCFEFVNGMSGELALANFVLRALTGLVVGFVGGWAMSRILSLGWVPEDITNVFVLGGAILVFGGTEAIGHQMDIGEAGLLAVVTAGFVLGALDTPGLDELKRFKADITELMIGFLFVILAAGLDFAEFRALGWRGVLLVAAVLVVVRPLNVLASSSGFGFGWREKVFLGWVAPRGIVAASMASLFAFALRDRPGLEEAGVFVETFTYSVIFATVLLHGFTAGPLARLLGLVRTVPTGWAVVGAHELAREIARFLGSRAKQPVVLVDTNARRIAQARAEGLLALEADARDRTLEERPELLEVGNLLALTDNEDLNTLLCERWRDRFGRDHLFRWGSAGSGDRSTAGLQVWAALPKPSVLSSELFHGEARVVQSLGAARHAGAHVWPLVAIADSGVVVDPDSPERLGSVEMLSLYREADYLQRAMRRELVVRLDVDSRAELYRELVKRVASLHPAVSTEATVDELLSRDETFPPAMGHGVAVPHAYSPALETRLVAIAQTPRGLDYRAHDGEPVRLVVLVLGPPGDPEGHLETLARIARLVGDPEMRQALAEAEVPNGVLELVRGFCCE